MSHVARKRKRAVKSTRVQGWRAIFGQAARECMRETGFPGCMRTKLATLRGRKK